MSPSWVQATTVFVVNSFSKTFAMTGWRIGYVIAENVERMTGSGQYYLTACPNDAMQYAVLAAIEQASIIPTCSPRNSRRVAT